MEQPPAFDKASNTGWRHFANAARFSANGFKAAFQNESAFRQELAVLAGLIPLGVWIADSVSEFVFLISMSLLVMVVELLNSGIEAAIDRHGQEYHEMAKLAKDYGSAAVMLSLVAVGMLWLVSLLEKLSLLP